MRKYVLLSLAVGLVLGPASQAPAQKDDSRALVARSIKAHGGEDKLNKLNAARAKAKGTMELMGISLPFTAESVAQLPSRFKSELQIDFMGQKLSVVQVLDGDKGWVTAMGQTQELQGELLTEMKEAVHASNVEKLTPLLKDPAYTLSPLGEIKVNGRPAVGVKVKSAKHKDVDLYFDKETALLVKTQREALNATQQKVAMESINSDFKEIEGVKRPMKVTVHQDGKKFMEMEVTDVKFLDRIDASEFAKP
jgi:hypothetical protein